MGARATVTRGPGGTQREQDLRAARKDVQNIEIELAGMKRDPATPAEWIAGSTERLDAAKARVAELEAETEE